MIIRTTFSLLGLAALGLANLNDYEYNYEEYDDAGDEESNPEEVDREVNYEQVNIFVMSMVIDQLTITCVKTSTTRVVPSMTDSSTWCLGAYYEQKARPACSCGNHISSAMQGDIKLRDAFMGMIV